MLLLYLLVFSHFELMNRVEVLTLHKLDYDTFVKDIQQAERRENFNLLKSCPLFENWARAKIERMANACTRKSVEENGFAFKQVGDWWINFYGLLGTTANVSCTCAIYRGMRLITCTLY